MSNQSNYGDVSDEEFKELGYTKEQAMWMNGLSVEWDIIYLRKKKHGIKPGYDGLLQYYAIYEPQRIIAAEVAIDQLRYEQAMEGIKEIKE